MSNTTQETQVKTGNSQSPLSHQKTMSTRPSSQVSRNSNGTKGRNRGNSKYSQKSRGKSKAPVAKPRGPVNTYTSVCCSLPATKPAAASAVAGSKEKTGLGHFRCSGCKKGCKVTVSKYKAPESLTNEGWKPSNEVRPEETVIAEVNNAN